MRMTEHDVRAEVSGNVWKVLRSVGDAVDSGDDIVVMESMKMEIPVFTSVSGTVASVLVIPGQQVTEDEVLAVVTT